MTQRVLDVSALPVGADDSRALLWWGNLGMMAIEGSMFAMLVATFLYLRMANLDWPPATVPKPALLPPTINLLLMLLTALPALLADRAALRAETGGVRLGLGICIAAGLVMLAVRVAIMANLGFKWSDHAYGSIVWTSFGFHTFHLMAATCETALLFVYALVRPLEKKQFLDIRCTAVYWYFVALMWVPFYFIIFVQPWMRRKGM